MEIEGGGLLRRRAKFIRLDLVALKMCRRNWLTEFFFWSPFVGHFSSDEWPRPMEMISGWFRLIIDGLVVLDIRCFNSQAVATLLV